MADKLTTSLARRRWLEFRGLSECIMVEAAGSSAKVEPNYDAFLKHVGKRIRAARRNAGMTQSQLAQQVGAKQPYIVAVEAGENLTLKSLARISAILNVEPVALLSFDELAPAVGADSSDQVRDLIDRAARDARLLSELLLRLQLCAPEAAGAVAPARARINKP